MALVLTAFGGLPPHVPHRVRAVSAPVLGVPGGQRRVVDHEQVLRVLPLSRRREVERTRDDRLPVDDCQRSPKQSHGGSPIGSQCGAITGPWSWWSGSGPSAPRATLFLGLLRARLPEVALGDDRVAPVHG